MVWMKSVPFGNGFMPVTHCTWLPRCGKTSGPTGKQCKSVSLNGKAARFKGLGKNQSSINPSISSRRRQCCLVTHPKGGLRKRKTHVYTSSKAFGPYLSSGLSCYLRCYKYGRIPQSSSKAALDRGPPLRTAATGAHQSPATMTGPLVPTHTTPKRW